MLVYANTPEVLKEGDTLELVTNSKMFTQLLDAELEAQLDELDAEDEGNKIDVFTYRLIVDIAIHDPHVIDQTKRVYLSNEAGKFPSLGGRWIEPLKFTRRLLDDSDNMSFITKNGTLQHQIEHFGFDAVYYFENGNHNIMTLRPVKAKVLGIVSRGEYEYIQ